MNNKMENQKERVEAPVQEQVVTTKKPFYKKKGFWAAMIVGAAALIGGGYAYMRSTGSKGDNSPETSGEVEETPRQQEHRDREDRGNNRDWRRHGNERNNNSNN